MKKSRHKCPDSNASAYMQYNEMTTQNEKKHYKKLYNREFRRYEKELLKAEVGSVIK